MAAAALEIHGSSPAVQRSAYALQEQMRAAWQNSAWLDDDDAGAAFDIPNNAAAAPTASAAGAGAALSAAALHWATRGLGSGASFLSMRCDTAKLSSNSLTSILIFYQIPGRQGVRQAGW